MVIIDDAHAWTMALLTAAHYELPEYNELRASPPPGGISCLAALALTGLLEMGTQSGLTPEETLFGFALSAHEMT